MAKVYAFQKVAKLRKNCKKFIEYEKARIQKEIEE